MRKNRPEDSPGDPGVLAPKMKGKNGPLDSRFAALWRFAFAAATQQMQRLFATSQATAQLPSKGQRCLSSCGVEKNAVAALQRLAAQVGTPRLACARGCLRYHSEDRMMFRGRSSFRCRARSAEFAAATSTPANSGSGTCGPVSGLRPLRSSTPSVCRAPWTAAARVVATVAGATLPRCTSASAKSVPRFRSRSKDTPCCFAALKSVA